MAVTDSLMVDFLRKFDENPFQVKMKDKEYKIGEGEPTFTVSFKEEIPMSEFLSSTSIALGEAYMDGKLEIEGDLYEALDHFLGQMGKFSTDTKGLKKLIHSSTSKSNQKKEVTSHYDIGNDFYKLWLDETMTYSCAYFKTEEDALEQAQRNKTERILEKLYLQQGRQQRPAHDPLVLRGAHRVATSAWCRPPGSGRNPGPPDCSSPPRFWSPQCLGGRKGFQ